MSAKASARSTHREPRYTRKELAALLPLGPKGKQRTAAYVAAMVRAGFVMSGRTATLRSALRWLNRHRKFRSRSGFYQ